jgi:hypothetical protein
VVQTVAKEYGLRRSNGARTAGVLFEPGPAGRLWQNIFDFSGRHPAAPQRDGNDALEVADLVASGAFGEGGNAILAAAFCVGNVLRPIAAIASAFALAASASGGEGKSRWTAATGTLFCKRCATFNSFSERALRLSRFNSFWRIR